MSEKIEITLIFTLVVIMLAIVVFVCIQVFRKPKEEKKNDEVIKQLSVQMSELLTEKGETNSISKNYEALNKTLMDERANIAKANEVIEQNLKSLRESTQSVPDVAKNISEIHKLFSNSKLRGNIGEIQLEHILGDKLGTLLKRQYPLENGTGIIDYYLATNPSICIDAKFPKDNWEKYIDTNVESFKQDFKNDVKARIKELQKYNQPVLMFIPSERIFADIVSWFQDVYEDGIEKGITIVSPSTLSYVLNIAYENNKNQAVARDIQKNIDVYKSFVNDRLLTWLKNYQDLIKEYNKFGESLKRLSKNSRPIVDELRSIENNKENKETYKNAIDAAKESESSIENISLENTEEI